MPDRTAPAVGIRLKSVREAQKISLREIADATKISTRTLEAIERGDFAKLPGGIYTRAVIRSYASSVGLDPESVLEEFLTECPAHVEPVPTLEPDAGERARAQSRIAVAASAALPRVTLAAAPLLLAVGVGYAVLSWNAQVKVLPSASLNRLADHGLYAAPAEPGVTPVSRLLGDGLPEPSAAVLETAALTLELQSASPCWISLRVDGRDGGSRLLGADERITVEADREVVLKVGDAGAVSVWINGQPAPPLGGAGEVVTRRITTDALPASLGS